MLGMPLSQFSSTDDDSVDIRASNVASTAANLLSQLSGQLQQLNTSQNQQSSPSPACHETATSASIFERPDAEYELPAPPSPDLLG